MNDLNDPLELGTVKLADRVTELLLLLEGENIIISNRLLRRLLPARGCLGPVRLRRSLGGRRYRLCFLNLRLLLLLLLDGELLLFHAGQLTMHVLYLRLERRDSSYH